MAKRNFWFLILLLHNVSYTSSFLNLLPLSIEGHRCPPSSEQLQRTGEYSSVSIVHSHLHLFGRSAKEEQKQQVELQLELTDDKIKSLFAWVCCAFSSEEDPRYNNLMLAFAAIFGTNLPDDSLPATLAKHSMQKFAAFDPNQPMGEALSQHERESASLGAMGAAQWLGQWQTRPHALLETNTYENVTEWERSLSRGCRRTLQRSLAQNFTITALPIRNHAAAPHSTLDHFQCVVEHEVRLLSGDDTTDMDSFFHALSAGISRYVGTTQMAGEIREYRDAETGRILAFAHEVRKGRTLRGQWFYGTNEASQRYVWFHSVRSCVERAMATDGIDVVDLGPSGSDAFSQLKAKYGFQSVTQWPDVADYHGPFWDYATQAPAKNGLEY